MEKTKVISVRLTESLLKKLETKTNMFRYYKRNAVVSQILEGVLDGADDDSLRTLVKHWSWSDTKLKVTVEKVGKF